MKFDFDTAILELGRRQMLKLRGARGVRVGCRAGMLWVTQEGRVDDQFLAPGSVIEIEADGLVLIEALAPSRALLETGLAPPKRALGPRFTAA